MRKLLIIILAAVAVISMNIFAKNAISQNENPPMSMGTEEPTVDPKLIVYYFHTTFRCVSCHKIEQYTREAIEKYFSNETSSGKIDFQMLNVDEPQNKHYIQDYQLYTKSVVLSSVKDGKEVKWKNLDKVWQLLRNKGKFYTYIKSETQGFLDSLKEDGQTR